MTDAEQIGRLAERLIAAVPQLDPGEQTIGLALIRKLAAGEPVSDQDVAAAVAVPESGVQGALARWPGVFRDENGRVVGFMGLSVEEFGEHRIEIDGQTLTAWCAWDTLFLPELLGQTARVRSRCPTTGEEISMTVDAHGPTDPHPVDTVLSFLAPQRPFDADVVRSFCHFVHFFASDQAAREWTEMNPRTFTVSIEQGFWLGQRTNAATFGEALRGEATGPQKSRA